jgi:putative oxidoreductase
MLFPWFRGSEKYVPLAIRIGLGVIFLAHGLQILFGAFGGPGIPGMTAFLNQIGFQPAGLWAWFVGLAMFLGGLGVLAGLLTRWSALFLVATMIGGIVLVHWRNGFFYPQGFEYNLTLIFMGLALILGGPGKWSIEGAMGKERSR